MAETATAAPQSHLVVTGHGQFASGLVSAASLIAGPRDYVHAVDFVDGDTDAILAKKLEECVQSISSEASVLFICDLMGGSPYKEAATYALHHPERFQVVLGANVGGLLDCLLKTDKLAGEELAENLLEASRKNLLRFKALPTAPRDAAPEDGI